MKNSLLPLLLSLILTMVLVSSCNKETEDEKAQNELIGTWNIDNSTADLSVGGVDLATYMTTNFNYTEEQAQMMVNLFTSGIEAGNQGTINFKDDNTYQFTNSEGVENGTWSINNDGSTLVLVYENETDNLTIVSLSSSNLKLRIPTESETVDLDDDGDDETTIDVDIELNLSK